MGLLAALKLPPPAAFAAASPPTATASPMPAPPAGVAPAVVDTGAAMPVSDMKVEDIAAAIMDRQAAILVGWESALDVFDKTMSSSADAEATSSFQTVVCTYYVDKLMGALVKQAPGLAELHAVVEALDGDSQRAAAANVSATLRDFVVDHAKAIGRLQQTILRERQGFISAVQARRESLEAAVAASAKAAKLAKGKAATAPRTDAIALGVMRSVLRDTFDSVDRVLSGSSGEALFRVLSEAWMRNATVYAGMGLRVEGVVVIRLNPNYTISSAHIQGSGGQKIAEQLLKDSENGKVDVFRLKARRRILLMAPNNWPKVILSLDENNGDLSTGSVAEGDTTSLRTFLLSHRMASTSNLTGD